MWDEIARLAGDEGLTILLTTHYLEEADRLADRIAIVDRGRVVAEGTPGRPQGRTARRRRPPGAARSGGQAGRTLLNGALGAVPGRARGRCVDGPPASAPAPTTERPRCPPCWPRWSGPGSAVAARRPSPGPRWTTSISATPAAVTPRRRRNGADRASPSRERTGGAPMSTGRLPDLVHDAASAHGVRPAARVPAHHADPAGDLAVPVRQPLPEGRRTAAASAPTSYLDYLVPGRGRDERASLQHVGGHGHARGDRARHAQPLPDHPGQPGGPHERAMSSNRPQHRRCSR